MAMTLNSAISAPLSDLAPLSPIQRIWQAECRACKPLDPATPASITAVNRLGQIDSKLALDAAMAARDCPCMPEFHFHLHLHRTDASRNMARFYELTLDRTLFGEVCVLRRWGRIGGYGRIKIEVFAEANEAMTAFLALARSKRARGYRLACARTDCG